MEVLGTVAASLQLVDCIWTAVSTLRTLVIELKAAPSRIREKASYLDFLVEILDSLKEAPSLQTSTVQDCIKRVYARTEQLRGTLLNDLERLHQRSHILHRCFRTSVFLIHERGIAKLLDALERDKSNLVLCVSIVRSDNPVLQSEPNMSKFVPFKVTENNELCSCAGDTPNAICPAHGALTRLGSKSMFSPRKCTPDPLHNAPYMNAAQSERQEDGNKKNMNDSIEDESEKPAESSLGQLRQIEADLLHRTWQTWKKDESRTPVRTPRSEDILRTGEIPNNEARFEEQNKAATAFDDAHSGERLDLELESEPRETVQHLLGGLTFASANDAFSIHGKAHAGTVIKASRRNRRDPVGATQHGG